MLEFLISVRDAFMISIMSWLGFGADVPADIREGAIRPGSPFIEIQGTTCPPSVLEKAMEETSGA